MRSTFSRSHPKFRIPRCSIGRLVPRHLLPCWMEITAYNDHKKAPSFPRIFGPQPKDTLELEPSFLCNQSSAIFGGWVARTLETLGLKFDLYNAGPCPEDWSAFTAAGIAFHHHELLSARAAPRQ